MEKEIIHALNDAKPKSTAHQFNSENFISGADLQELRDQVSRQQTSLFAQKIALKTLGVLFIAVAILILINLYGGK